MVEVQVMAEESLRAQNEPRKPLIFPKFFEKMVIKRTDFGHNLQPPVEAMFLFRIPEWCRYVNVVFVCTSLRIETQDLLPENSDYSPPLTPEDIPIPQICRVNYPVTHILYNKISTIFHYLFWLFNQTPDIRSHGIWMRNQIFDVIRRRFPGRPNLRLSTQSDDHDSVQVNCGPNRTTNSRTPC